MTSRFELWNNLNRAMTPLAHWYAIIDNQVILELQNKVIHEVLHDRYCLIKWAPMHEQVTLLRKLLSHIFEHYAEVQDDGYISDEDIEEYPEIFMPRPCIMPIELQEPAFYVACTTCKVKIAVSRELSCTYHGKNEHKGYKPGQQIFSTVQ